MGGLANKAIWVPAKTPALECCSLTIDTGGNKGFNLRLLAPALGIEARAEILKRTDQK